MLARASPLRHTREQRRARGRGQRVGGGSSPAAGALLGPAVWHTGGVCVCVWLSSPESQRLYCVQVFKLAQLAGGVALTQDAQVLPLHTPRAGQGRARGRGGRRTAQLAVLGRPLPAPASSSSRPVYAATPAMCPPGQQHQQLCGRAPGCRARCPGSAAVPCPPPWLSRCSTPQQGRQASRWAHHWGCTVPSRHKGSEAAVARICHGRAGGQDRQRGVAHMICVAPASRLFSSISFRALEGRCSICGGLEGVGERRRQQRRTVAAARQAGKWRGLDPCAAYPSCITSHSTCLYDLARSDAVHHRLLQPSNCRHVARLALGGRHGRPQRLQIAAAWLRLAPQQLGARRSLCKMGSPAGCAPGCG